MVFQKNNNPLSDEKNNPPSVSVSSVQRRAGDLYFCKLRNRFLRLVEKKWKQNDHSLQQIPAVYIIAGYDIFNNKSDIFYVGSSTNLFMRYKSHKVPSKVQSEGFANVLYFLPMEYGFYDYEIKLIKSLNPKFNKQHR